MATTENGIYYPTDGTQPADVLSDMQEMAESIDSAINANKYDDTEIKKDITKIKKEQETQNKSIEKNAENIEDNATDIQDLKEENANLKAQIPTGQESREEISLSDSAEMELVDFGLQGNSRQETREGYNLIQASNEFRKGYAGSGITGSVTDEGYLQVVAEEGNANYINSFWSLNSQNSMAKVKEILKAGDTFTIAFTIKRTEGTSAAPRVYIKENTSYKGMTGTVTTEFKQVYYTGVWEEGNDISIIHLGFASLTGTFIIKDWLVKKGDLADWEDYGAKPSLDYSSEVQAVGDSGSEEIVKSNKNIFNIPDYDKTQSGINVKITNGNHLKITGTSTSNTTFYILNSNNNAKQLKNINQIAVGKNITIQKNSTPENSVELNIATSSNAYFMQLVKSTVSVTKLLDKDIFVFSIYIPANTTWNWETDLQFELGDTATEIIRSKGNTYPIPIQKPFYKIGDYTDKFIKQANKWYEQHECGEYIFTGEEDYQKSPSYSDNNWFCGYITGAGSITTVKQDGQLMATRFSKIGNYSQILDENCIRSSSQFHVRVSTSSLTENTAAAYKALLKQWYDEGSPLKVIYQRTTPELLECTEEQTQILEQIVKDGTFKEVTHFYTTEDLKPIIEVKYYKDLETLFNKQAELENTLNNVQAQILELGGN